MTPNTDNIIVQVTLDGKSLERLADSIAAKVADRLKMVFAEDSDEEKPITLTELCRTYKVYRKTIMKMIREGTIPYHQSASRYYFYISEVDEILKDIRGERVLKYEELNVNVI